MTFKRSPATLSCSTISRRHPSGHESWDSRESLLIKKYIYILRCMLSFYQNKLSFEFVTTMQLRSVYPSGLIFTGFTFWRNQHSLKIDPNLNYTICRYTQGYDHNLTFLTIKVQFRPLSYIWHFRLVVCCVPFQLKFSMVRY